MKKLIIFVLTLFLTFTIFLSSKSANAEITPVTPFYEGDILNGKDLYLFSSYSTTPNFDNGYISKKTISQQDIYYQENSYFNGWYKNLGLDLINTYTEPDHEPENPYFYFYITFNNMLGQYMQLALYSLEPYEAEYIIKYSDNTYTQLTANQYNEYLLTTPQNETTKEVVWLCWSVYYPDYLASFRPLTAQLAYDFGFSSGESEGFNRGYNNGYSTGYNNGHTDGYNEGSIDTQYGVNTVVDFNQLIHNGNFINDDYWQFYGVNYTISNNILSFTSTAQSGGIASNILNIVSGHKYLALLDIKTTAQNNATVIRIGYTSTPIYISPSVDFSTKNIFFEYGSNTRLEIYDVRPSNWDEIQLKNIMVFDLTQIYGEGNEPTTIEPFRVDFPSNYYNFTTSSLINIDYENGYIKGQKLGYNLGYDDGKDAQATQQLTSTGWLNSIFGGISSLLNIQIFPGVTIGIIVGIPFVISLAYFVIRAFRGGGGA